MPKAADVVEYAYAGDISKFDETPDGHLMVHGVASSPRLDLDDQIADPAWLKSALPEWQQWGNVRAMHSSVAAGVGKELAEGDGDKWGLKSLIVDKDSIDKVKTGVYKGYSIGIRGARVVKDASAPNGRIVGGKIVEISLVDRPCNPDSVMSIAKAHGAGLAPVDSAGVLVAKFDDADTDNDADIPVDKTEPEPESEQVETPADVDNSADVSFAEKVLARLDAIEKMLSGKPAEPKKVKKDKHDDAPDVTKRVEVDAQVTTPDTDHVTEIVTKAVAEADKAHKAEIATLRDQLAKVLNSPVAGGPMITNALPTPAPAQTVPALVKTAAYYEAMADRATDPSVKSAYLDKAREVSTSTH